ncbi:Sex comb on midleg-like protein 4 [Aix galericulata]|nr:Sex comb on midleg-like protein 4 [Aix galericulata]
MSRDAPEERQSRSCSEDLQEELDHLLQVVENRSLHSIKSPRLGRKLTVAASTPSCVCQLSPAPGHMSASPPPPASRDPVAMQSPRIAGRKRGRPPLQPAPIKVAVHNLFSAPAGALPLVKIPKKRGRKPGHKLKSRVLMTPLAVSPPRSTPEPDVSSIPQDAATIPNSAAPQALTVCIYVNKQASLGPYLDRKKVQQLPEHFGPERPSTVLQQAVQAFSASFEGKQHLLSLLAVNSIGYVLRFLKKLCRSLLCDNLFSNQPFQQYSAAPGTPEVYENRRMEAGEEHPFMCQQLEVGPQMEQKHTKR